MNWWTDLYYFYTNTQSTWKFEMKGPKINNNPLLLYWKKKLYSMVSDYCCQMIADCLRKFCLLPHPENNSNTLSSRVAIAKSIINYFLNRALPYVKERSDSHSTEFYPISRPVTMPTSIDTIHFNWNSSELPQHLWGTVFY